MKKIFSNGNFVQTKLPRMLLFMKVLAVFLVMFSVQVNAMFFSQEKRLDISLNDVSLTEVFRYLRQHSDYRFMYDSEVVKRVHSVSVNMKNADIRDILDHCLKGAGLGFLIEDEVVIIRAITVAVDSVNVKSLFLHGVVRTRDKQPMPGVTIKLIGTLLGTASDANGYFAVNLPVAKGKLEFSSVGYEKKIVEFTERTAKDTLCVVLEEEVQNLDEAVVVAYGTTTRRKATGAISVVKAEELRGIPSASIENLLQGRVAGMNVTTMSGAPGGGGVAVTIRGYNSLDVEQGRRFSNPLWVVDGVPLNSFTSPISGTNLLSDLNPDMIESIQILKDASSAAIYGSRAANGVVIVTTKKGMRNQNATFAVNFSQSWSVLPELPTVTTGRAERDLRLKAMRNKFSAYFDKGTNTYKYPTSLREQYDHIMDDASFDGNFIPAPNNTANGNMFQDSLNVFYNNSTNYFPMYYVKGKITNANIQTYGGTERMIYGIGLGYYDESGVFKGTGYNRLDLNSSLNVKPVPRLNVDLRFNISASHRKRGTKSELLGGAAPSVETVPGEPYKLSSLLPGKGSVAWNTVLDAYKKIKEKNRAIRLRSNFKLGYDIFKGLNISTSLAADYSIDRRNYFKPSYLSDDKFSMSMGETGINLMVLSENLLSYNCSIKEKHTINFVAGFSYQYDQTEYNGGSAENSPSDKIIYAPNGMPEIGEIVYESWGKQYKNTIAFQHYLSDMQEKVLLSYFARLEYNYDDKYLLSLSLRRDGSSTFGEKRRWGTFPSAALAWTFSEESFIKNNISWLSFGKIRVSWGCSGMHFSQNYLALGILNVGKAPYLGNPIIEPNWREGLYNSKLSWEETSQWDVGVDLDFFEHRLGVTLDYYYRYTDKLLDLVSLPGAYYNAYENQWRNAAAISNEGVEFMVKYDIFRKNNLYWRISVNGAKNWNRYEKSYDGKDDYGRVIGKPLNGIYALQTEGFVNAQEQVPYYYDQLGQRCYLARPYMKELFYKPGDYNFVDLDGDMQITSPNSGYNDLMYMGSTLPKINGGIVNEFRWKNIDVNMSFSYSLGGHLVNKTIKRALSDGNEYQALVFDLDKIKFWEKPGDTPDYPLFQTEQLVGLFDIVDRDVEKVNFLKLKTLTVGYVLPKQWIRKIGLSELRLFVSGENLFTWTNYSGLDPETVDIMNGRDEQANYPLARKYTLGLTLKF